MIISLNNQVSEGFGPSKDILGQILPTRETISRPIETWK